MPAELVNRLARMFQDIKVSQDLSHDFQESLVVASTSSNAGSEIGCPSSGLVVSIKILSSGTWLPRNLPKLSVALPPELEDFIPQVRSNWCTYEPITFSVDMFGYAPLKIEDFYKRKYQGRQLIWQYHLSHGLLAYYPLNQSLGGDSPCETATIQPVELEVTTLQIVVLLAWRYRDITHKLRLDDLVTATGLSDADLRRSIWVNKCLLKSVSIMYYPC